MKFSPRLKKWLIAFALLGVWCVAHVPAIGLFAHVPFVSAVVGDEPSPLYGALAILRDKSPLGLRNLPQLYYGPLFGALAVPAVIFDAGMQFITGNMKDAEGYRALITRDMGGMLIASRWLAVLAGFLALFGVYRLFQMQRINLEGKAWWIGMAVFGIALDPFFFKYSHFFRHWIFIVAVLIWNIVFVMRIAEKPDDKKSWIGLWATSAIGFGISFISLFYQTALFPAFWSWVKTKRMTAIKYFVAYAGALAGAIVVLVVWNPFPYFRLVRMGTESGTGHTLRIGLPSLVSYASYLWNNYALIGMLAVGLSVLAWVVARDRVRTWWWMVVWPGMAHLAFFVASETNPPRYLLPVYVLLWIVAVACLTATWSWLAKRRLAVPLLVMMCLALTLSSANALRWSWLASQIQPEERLIEALRETSASSSVWYVGRLLPAWHDPSSYKNYSDTCLDYESDLFPYMATLGHLEQAPPIYVEYWCSLDPMPTEIQGYATDIIEPMGESLESNAYEANWWRHWDTKTWGLRFRAVKGNLSL